MIQRALALRPPPPKTMMIIFKLSQHLKPPPMKICKKLAALHPHLHQHLQDSNNKIITAQIFGVKNHPGCESFQFKSKMRKCNRRGKREKSKGREREIDFIIKGATQRV